MKRWIAVKYLDCSINYSFCAEIKKTSENIGVIGLSLDTHPPIALCVKTQYNTPWNETEIQKPYEVKLKDLCKPSFD